ncbi:MAG TPA: HDOD domain-containing protein, partial [Methylomirabilota bacterium]|nr:HDOD domain-containing protein [Methylomirabilota bacterium]
MAEKFIARQPIFDKRLRVFAYELLFRGGPQNYFIKPSRNAAASSVIADSITLFDLNTLTGNALAFINVDELALRLDAPRLLPPDRVIIEILETVTPSDEIVRICRDLIGSGYTLALDDFVDHPKFASLVECAKYLKVDFQLLDPDGRRRIVEKYANSGISFLAEKVETEEELAEARHLGYSYFQGYFFCRPSMMETREIPGNKLLQLRLLNLVSGPELDYSAIEELLKNEPSLLYRLLRYLNSPLLGLRSEVHSVRHALTLLGEREFRRWVSIFAVIALASGKPPELIRTALTRAYFCEAFSHAARMDNESSTLFLMGLLSITDALLDQPIADVLRSLPVDEKIKTALTGGQNRHHDVYELLLALERAEWPRLSACADRLAVSEASVPDAFQSALQKASAIGT